MKEIGDGWSVRKVRSVDIMCLLRFSDRIIPTLEADAADNSPRGTAEVFYPRVRRCCDNSPTGDGSAALIRDAWSCLTTSAASLKPPSADLCDFATSCRLSGDLVGCPFRHECSLRRSRCPQTSPSHGRSSRPSATSLSPRCASSGSARSLDCVSSTSESESNVGV